VLRTQEMAFSHALLTKHDQKIYNTFKQRAQLQQVSDQQNCAILRCDCYFIFSVIRKFKISKILDYLTNLTKWKRCVGATKAYLLPEDKENKAYFHIFGKMFVMPMVEYVSKFPAYFSVYVLAYQHICT
jgi:DNA primase catalytic subunit